MFSLTVSAVTVAVLSLTVESSSVRSLCSCAIRIPAPPLSPSDAPTVTVLWLTVLPSSVRLARLKMPPPPSLKPPADGVAALPVTVTSSSTTGPGPAAARPPPALWIVVPPVIVRPLSVAVVELPLISITRCEPSPTIVVVAWPAPSIVTALVTSSWPLAGLSV